MHPRAWPRQSGDERGRLVPRLVHGRISLRFGKWNEPVSYFSASMASGERLETQDRKGEEQPPGGAGREGGGPRGETLEPRSRSARCCVADVQLCLFVKCHRNGRSIKKPEKNVLHVGKKSAPRGDPKTKCEWGRASRAGLRATARRRTGLGSRTETGRDLVASHVRAI